jgi:hypothetical protein
MTYGRKKLRLFFTSLQIGQLLLQAIAEEGTNLKIRTIEALNNST